ncbi:MAG TPA: serine/threonine-protein kinase [Candidatus Solibacter sp.]|jgi:serine/threonine protein kinase|nr:serine/threonine-protein kinase [Candidatus Solibacter sp.]
MTRLSALAPGDQLDQFEIVAHLGDGAFSDVYRARDRSGREVVLKCPHEVILGDTTTFDRFRREMKIASRLDHPGIQRSLDIGANRSRVYMVMEYVEGTTLRKLLNTSRGLSVERTISVAKQLCDAAGYAHSRGVFHRDLKPENILITPTDRVVLTDFGVALMEGAKRLTFRALNAQVGTPTYMAPEQVQGKRGDARTDIYAIGVIVFEMLAGRPPWVGEDVFAVMDMHLTAPVPDLRKLNRKVPATLRGIVQKCLRKDPAQRYQTCAAILEDLEHWQELDPAAFVFEPERPLKRASEAWVWALVGGLSLGFLLAAAAITYVYYLATHSPH